MAGKIAKILKITGISALMAVALSYTPLGKNIILDFARNNDFSDKIRSYHSIPQKYLKLKLNKNIFGIHYPGAYSKNPINNGYNIIKTKKGIKIFWWKYNQ